MKKIFFLLLVLSTLPLAILRADSYMDLDILVVENDGLVYDANKNVGINTAAPTQKLHVRATTQFHDTTSFKEFTNVCVNGSPCTINWNNGNKQRLRYSGGGITVTFTNPPHPSNLLLIIEHTETSGPITWTGVLFPSGDIPILSEGDPDAVDIINLYFSGTQYFAVSSLNFVPTGP